MRPRAGPDLRSRRRTAGTEGISRVSCVDEADRSTRIDLRLFTWPRGPGVRAPRSASDRRPSGRTQRSGPRSIEPSVSPSRVPRRRPRAPACMPRGVPGKTPRACSMHKPARSSACARLGLRAPTPRHSALTRLELAVPSAMAGSGGSSAALRRLPTTSGRAPSPTLKDQRVEN